LRNRCFDLCGLGVRSSGRTTAPSSKPGCRHRRGRLLASKIHRGRSSRQDFRRGKHLPPAILFGAIPMIPHALEQPVSLFEGEGPRPARSRRPPLNRSGEREAPNSRAIQTNEERPVPRPTARRSWWSGLNNVPGLTSSTSRRPCSRPRRPIKRLENGIHPHGYSQA
jgi:hypothetical protein